MDVLVGYRRPQPGTQPEPPASALSVFGEAGAPPASRRSPPHALRGDGAGVRAGRGGREGLRPDPAARGPVPPASASSSTGRVLDEDGRPAPHTLVELWQANAAGRYLHDIDQHDAPLDPNFTGSGHTLTDAEGRYRFVTIRPGAYPWRNHHNAWRPAHVHFSVFGPAFATRLVTQMYFPGDPLLAHDPIFNGTADEGARDRLVSAFDWDATIPEHALGYRFDIVLSGREATPMEVLS